LNINESATANTVTTAMSAEVDSYLTCTSTDTPSLTAFPRLATAFHKNNAALPSSAAV